MGPNLLNNYVELASVIIFCIGFSTLLFNQNLIKKVIAFNIMDTAIFLFLAAKGYIQYRVPAIITEDLSAANFVNPLPAGLVLTGIVVSVSVTAFFLALIIRLYEKYGTYQLDEIIFFSNSED